MKSDIRSLGFRLRRLEWHRVSIVKRHLRSRWYRLYLRLWWRDFSFSPNFYCYQYPDILTVGMDPYEHYVRFGRGEGRLGTPQHFETGRTIGETNMGKRIRAFQSRLRLLTLRRARDLKKNLRSLWFYLFLRIWQRDFSFSRRFYLEQYPDVAAAGIDPYEHYVRFGRTEGRLGCESFLQASRGFAKAPTFEVIGNFESIDKSRETVLVVSHEGSRTGAPVLSYNLVLHLRKTYNVVALFLGAGPMLEACHAMGAVVIGPVPLRGSPAIAEAVIRYILDSVNIKFALVNSVESRFVLEWLYSHQVPTVSLIHEFATYTRPASAFPETVFWSGQTVFSSSITRDNALAEFSELGTREYPLISQGRCVLPQRKNGDEKEGPRERARIRRVMRPADFAAGGLVVLGAGYVQYRKGVDLFVDCAYRLRRLRPDLPCRFVWIGKGYDLRNDAGYSVYLADQIRRAGLEEVVHFTDEVADLAAAYELADVFLLSSRLDPLPNVVIDALANKLPVVCFDRTTGMASILREHGLGETCVAAYLDTDEMTRKVLSLAESRSHREKVTERGAQVASSIFDMDRYLVRLEEVAAREAKRIEQQQRDMEVISATDLLQWDFFKPPHLRFRNQDEALRWYVRSWASGVWRRRAFPGFHPGIYRERHGTAHPDADPLADYLRAGRPPGPWVYEVISSAEKVISLPPEIRIGLHIHAYYTDLIPPLIERLGRNRVRPDLLISVANEEARQIVEAQLRHYNGGTIEIRVVPNHGRDIGPFLTEFGETILGKYDIVGHLHTKKTADVGDAAMGQMWYQFLLENLLGGQASMADIILGRMATDPKIRMVFPDDPNVVGWGKNLQQATDLLGRLGIEKVYQEILFPIGTMFWARTGTLKPLFDMGFKWADYPEEPLPYDGSLLHALERVLGVIGTSHPGSFAVTNVPGRSR